MGIVSFVSMKKCLLAALLALVCSAASFAQEWSAPVRGSWVRADGQQQAGDVVLAINGDGCEIVVAGEENSAVKQAAVFVAGDIERISGYKPPIVSIPTGKRVAIRLATLTDAVTL